MHRGRLTALAALLFAFGAVPGSARAELAIAPGSFQVSPLDASDQPDLRAGAHPDRLVASFAFNTHDDGTADGNARDIVIDLPPGFAGDAGATPACARGTFIQNGCDPNSQVGVLRARFVGFSGPLSFPLYNVAPRDDELAEFGSFALFLPLRLSLRWREETNDGIEIRMLDLPQSIPLVAAEVELWGIPADHQAGTTIPRKALLTNPTSCDGPSTTALHVRSWEQPDHRLDASSAPAPLTGCDQIPFAPTVSATLDTPQADTPSGLAIDVALAQDDDPDGRVPSQAAGFTATLPGGLTLSPGVASGLAACDDAAFALGTTDAPHCPDAAKLGTLQLAAPGLRAPLTGALFLGRPLPAEPFRLFATAAGPGIFMKLTGSLHADPATGRISLTLDDLPQLPFSDLRLHFKSGPRAPLATPAACGPAAVTTSLAARRGGAAVRRAAILELTAGPGGAACPPAAPFAPGFAAGSTRALAGSSSAFAVVVTRPDGQQPLDRLAVTLPPGVSARLASAARCPAALATQMACPGASRVGSVTVEAGAGSRPLPLTGGVYLTGPHAGAPFGLALTLHAQAGPLALGDVVVLAGLRLDPDDARVTVTTDSLPQLLGGIPLRLRTLALDIDRSGFVRNATSCRPSRATADFASLDAATAHAAARYALGGCRRLRFAPTVGMRLGPRRALRRGGRPTVTIVLRSQLRQATVRDATLQLPRALALDPPLGIAVCTQERARDDRCPAGSAVGTARVRTPLLPAALAGTVDVVQPRRGTQPELWTTVSAMGVRLTLRATTSAPANGPVSTRFADLPDIPISALRLRLAGGEHGVLRVAGRSLCASGASNGTAARAALTGHNDAVRTLRVGARVTC